MGLSIDWVNHGHLLLLLELVVVLDELLLVLVELFFATEIISFAEHLRLGNSLLAKLVMHLLLVCLHLLLLLHNGLLELLLLVESGRHWCLEALQLRSTVCTLDLVSLICLPRINTNCLPLRLPLLRVTTL